MNNVQEHGTQKTNTAGFPPAPPKAHQRAVGKTRKAKRDIYQEVTDRIVEAMEKGVNPWRCPWDRGGELSMPKNHATGAYYRGINIPLLWIAQEERHFSSSSWLTYKQAQALGGQVRRGETGTVCIFFKTWDRDTGERNDQGEKVIEQIPMAKAFTVFNLDQIEGIETPAAFTAGGGFDPIETAEELIRLSGVDVEEGGPRACYVPALDLVKLPDRERFNNASDYYATAAHELIHATKAESRCNRKPYETTVKKGAYAFEELVAELGSLFVMTSIGLKGDFLGHASYLDGWLSVLKEDKRAIFRASSQAQKAADWLLGQAEE